MIKLIKGDAVKVLSPESSLLALLEVEGWTVEGEEKEAPRRGRPPKEKAEE
jgi:hypothetical protein